MEIKIKTIQNYLNELAAELGVVAYRPDYHGKKGDCYTVLFYEKDAEAHNRLVDTQPTRYTRSEARDIMKRYHVSVGPECVYEDYFWAFENSDANGCLSADFANHGQLDLRGLDWRDSLRGAAMLALNRTREFSYVMAAGGPMSIPEADERYNDFNREAIEATRLKHGRVWLGDVNGDKDSDILTEYTGGPVYNGSCAFCVPVKDQELEDIIRKWRLEGDVKMVGRAMDRVKAIGGTWLSWV